MDGVILYQSKYGSTKKYVQWLSEETGFPCNAIKQAKLSDVQAGSMRQASRGYPF